MFMIWFTSSYPSHLTPPLGLRRHDPRGQGSSRQQLRDVPGAGAFLERLGTGGRDRGPVEKLGSTT